MRRRELIAGAAAAAAWPVNILAQDRRAAKIAIALPVGPVEWTTDTAKAVPYWRSFFAEMRRLGWVEGVNLAVERRSAGGRAGAYEELAKDIVALKPDLIIAIGGPLVQQFKAATTTIPIVAQTGDPVSMGFAASMARPGGNITGVTADAGFELWGKHLEFMASVVPGLERVGFLAPQASMQGPQASLVEELAAKMNLLVVRGGVEGDADEDAYRRAFDRLVQGGAQAVVMNDNPQHWAFVKLILDLAAIHRLPASYPYKEFADRGGLLAYAADLHEFNRVQARIADRILRGEKPGQIPFEQPNAFVLVVNLKTAKALGLTIPSTLLARADEVIE